jgi:hypothetical protein
MTFTVTVEQLATDHTLMLSDSSATKAPISPGIALVAEHHYVRVARRARGPDRRPRCKPRTGAAWAPWRIGYSPLIHQMICYSNPLKFHTEKV